MRRSSRPCHDALTPGPIVDWLASWTVSYFDAMAKVHVMAVVKNEELGADAFAAALDACHVQTRGVLNQRLARWARQMEGVMNAFPGATECNTESVRFVEDVQSRAGAGGDTAPGGAVRRVAGAGVRLGSCRGAAGTA